MCTACNVLCALRVPVLVIRLDFLVNDSSMLQSEGSSDFRIGDLVT